MNDPKPFRSELVIQEAISEAELRAYSVGFDQNKFRLQPLVDVICRVIPEYAFGVLDPATASSDWVDKLREAAKSVYTTNKYANRGEFGELILHLLLRDYCGTVPLISKIYFKDTDNATVHGFDAVQVTANGDDKKLWLGESKFYTDGRSGIAGLMQDLRNHLEADYLRREFALITKKLPRNNPEIERWRTLLHPHQKLDTIFRSVVIPMVCTYSSDLYSTHFSETEMYLQDFIAECRTLSSDFSSRRITTSCEVVLMLLPVPSKNELCRELHQRLDNMRNI
jgi:hypothetical protein